MTRSVTWASLSRPAKAYRVFHASWSVAGLASLGYIWACAATRRRNRRLGASIAFLSLEGVGLIIGGGDCPMGPFQEQLGDPVPFFELLLPPRAAKAAVPILAGASVAGMLAVLVRRPKSPTYFDHLPVEENDLAPESRLSGGLTEAHGGRCRP